MKIAHFSNDALPVSYYGGVERMIVWLLEALSRMGHKNYLIAPHGTVSQHAEVIPVGRVRRITEESPDLRGIIPSDADVLHYNPGYSFREYGIPTLKTIHGYAWVGWTLDDTFNFLSDAHRKAYGRPDLPYVHYGLNPDEYLFREKKEDYLLFLSKADWKVKGLPIAVRAARRAGAKLIIAGNAHRKFVEGYAGFGFLRRHFSHRCLYVGEVGGDIKAAYLARAKALIFPIQWEEPFGLVAIEAMASGTPVITFRSGAMPEIVKDTVTGFICDTEDQMVDAVRRVDDLDPHKCRQHILEHFTSERMALDYLALYKTCMA